VIEDRPHRPAAETPLALQRRVRGWLGLPEEPLPARPPRPRIEPLRRTWLAAFWQARISVQAKVPLNDYLRSRLARYLAVLPVPRARLPLHVQVEDGELIVRPVELEHPGKAGDGSDGWLAQLVAVEGPAPRQEVAEMEVRLAMLEGEIAEARRRTEELQRRLAADVATGRIAAPPTIEATAEQMGRPTVRSAWPQAALYSFAAITVAAETWQIAMPLFRSSSLDPARLRAELLARPAEVVFAATFALAISAGLFALAQGALDTAAVLSHGAEDRRRRGWLGAAAAGAAVLSVLVASAASALPAPTPAMPVWSYVLLLLAVPVGTTLLLRGAREERARREAERGASLSWDRERARSLSDRARRLEELDWAEQEEHDLERRRELARRRLQEIASRALAAARLAVEAEQRERAALSRLAQSLVGALELDRYEFIRQASARGAPELFATGRRKPISEPRPAPILDPTAGAAGAVEAGRLAS